jgi:hypothetical protein
MKPRKGKRVGDASFRYTPAHATDVAATFARIRAERAAAKAKVEAEKLQHQPIQLRKVASAR